MATRAVKLGGYLKELRIHLCQKSSQSQGVRDFIEKYYVDLKKTNPKFPILIRECSGIQPRMYARYDAGKESSLPLTNLKAEDVMKQLEILVTKKVASTARVIGVRELMIYEMTMEKWWNDWQGKRENPVKTC